MDDLGDQLNTPQDCADNPQNVGSGWDARLRCHDRLPTLLAEAHEERILDEARSRKGTKGKKETKSNLWGRIQLVRRVEDY